ncbi:hypothetical protein AGMMS50233_10150 [Endomicrobiia bacterium]|nr:hypothetical protein AGMMS50233_10150 [Endomicrobiia bacterium]
MMIGKKIDFRIPLAFGFKIKELKESHGWTSSELVRQLKQQCGLEIAVSYITHITIDPTHLKKVDKRP